MKERIKEDGSYSRRLLDTFLPSENVLYGTRLTSQRQVLSMIAEKAAAQCSCSSHEILRAFIEREKLGSTALGNGVALPHARLDKIDNSFAVFLSSRNPIPFDAPDEEGVRIFFALLAPNNHRSRGLHDLSRLARLLRQDDVRRDLLQEDTPKRLWAIIKDAYKNIDNGVETIDQRNGQK